MKILMIGGTGNISSAVTKLLARQEHDVSLYCLSSGVYNDFNIKGVNIHYGNVNDEERVKAFLNNNRYDVVVDWTIFNSEHVKRDIRLFMDKTDQYIYISSASAYQRPSRTYKITEDITLENPFWDYSRGKIEAEKILMKAYKEQGFPVTIVRPSLTYGDTIIPYVLVSFRKPWSLVDRIIKGKRVIVPGDGTSLWEVTHNTDFAKGICGLMGKKEALGEAYHITSGEVMTWDYILEQIAAAIGVEAKPVHISSDFITVFMPDQIGNLHGDKITSVVFDNTKLKSIVPDFTATTPLNQGIAQTISNLKSRPELQVIDEEYEAALDRVIEAYDYGISFANN